MPRAERLAVLGLLVAMAFSAISLLVLSRDLTFWSDELDWLTFTGGFAPDALLTPHNGHLIGVVRTVHEAFPEVFGVDYLPFRLLSIAAVLACGALFFVLARRRIGGPLALAPTLILLFFGSSSEVVVSPVGLPITLSIAFGLGAFVAIERDSRPGDVAAVLLLSLSVLSDTFGTIIAGGAAVYLLLDPATRRRVWVAAVPILLWVAWWLWSRKFDQDIGTISNLPGVPLFMLESAAATVGGITGAGKSFTLGGGAAETITQVAFGAIALAGAAVVVMRARSRGAGPALLAFALILLVFWASVGLAESDVRQPTTPRYLFFAAIMVFLVLAESFRGERLRGRALAAVLAVLALCFAGNVARLVDNAAGLTRLAERVGTQIAMVELAGASANPQFIISTLAPRGSGDVVVSSNVINDFANEYGSLGFSLDEVSEQAPKVRADGDFVLANAIAAAAAPVPVESAESIPDCVVFEGDEAAPARFEIPPGINVIRLQSGSGVPLLIGRFGDEATVPLGTLTEETPLGFALPEDDATADRPWFGTVAASVQLCGVDAEN